jgi:hypothetical protein
MTFSFSGCSQSQNSDSSKGDAEIVWYTVSKTGSPSFQNGWENYNDFYYTTFYQPLQFGLDEEGYLHIVGSIIDTTPVSNTSETVFTLPPGFRPVLIQDFTISGLNTYLGYADYTLSIMPDGSFTLGTISATTQGQSIIYLGHLIIKLK